jgi:hypothetical protein
MGKTPPPSDARIDLLVSMVLALLMEVEALREAFLELDSTTSGAKAGYSRAYRDTAYLTHNCAGPSGGLDKLLGLFYPQEPDWRECLMLRRLGFSEEQIRVYKAEAQQAHVFT